MATLKDQLQHIEQAIEESTAALQKAGEQADILRAKMTAMRGTIDALVKQRDATHRAITVAEILGDYLPQNGDAPGAIVEATAKGK